MCDHLAVLSVFAQRGPEQMQTGDIGEYTATSQSVHSCFKMDAVGVLLIHGSIILND